MTSLAGCSNPISYACSDPISYACSDPAPRELPTAPPDTPYTLALAWSLSLATPPLLPLHASAWPRVDRVSEVVRFGDSL